MALTLAITAGFDAANVVASEHCTYIIAVTNAGSTSVTLSSLTAYAPSTSPASVGVPQYLTPNVPAGTGNPVLLPSTTYYYPVSVEFTSPVTAGPSPQSPGGAAYANAMPTNSAQLLTVQSVSSDGTSATTAISVGLAAAIGPFPIALGGGLQLSSSMNLINFLTSCA